MGCFSIRCSARGDLEGFRRDSNHWADIVSTVTNGTCPEVITRTWVATNFCTEGPSFCSQAISVICPDCADIVITKACLPFAVQPGGILTFTGTVTNTGGLVLTNVLVYNDQPASNTLVFGPAILSPGEGATFAASYTVGVCGPYEDTLTVFAGAEGGLIVSNSVTAGCPGATDFVPGDRDGDGIVDQNELNAVLSNYWAHSEWISMTNAAVHGGGLFEFALTNASSWNFSVLVSTNLTDWTPLPGPAYPLYQFYDRQATNQPMRYYRLVWPC